MKARIVALVALGACGGTPKLAESPAARPEAEWTRVGDVEWGVALARDHFEVDLIRGRHVLAIADGRQGRAFDADWTFPARALPAAPELEQLDREFAARSDADGAVAWEAMFAPDGAEWSDGRRVEQPQIASVMTGVLLGATMTWQPVASGRAGDVGFTIGTYALASRHSAQREDGSYCTIWRAQPDGSWKIVLDVGSATTR